MGYLSSPTTPAYNFLVATHTDNISPREFLENYDLVDFESDLRSLLKHEAGKRKVNALHEGQGSIMTATSEVAIEAKANKIIVQVLYLHVQQTLPRWSTRFKETAHLPENGADLAVSPTRRLSNACALPPRLFVEMMSR